MESLNLIKNDPWLAPYKEAIEGRYQYVIDKEKSLTNKGKQTLSEMASGYLGPECHGYLPYRYVQQLEKRGII